MRHGNQLLSLGWEDGSWEVYCFHRALVCEEATEVLHSMSGPDMGSRVHVERSAALETAVVKGGVKDEVLAHHFGWALRSSVPGTPAQRFLSYFVLSTSGVVAHDLSSAHEALKMVGFADGDVSGLLSVAEEGKVSALKQVTFGTEGAAVLQLDMGNVFQIEFFDDAAREVWREGLNQALAAGTSEWHKRRDVYT